MKLATLGTLLLLCIIQLNAQNSPPDTDIFVFDLSENSNDISISNGRNITKRKGYDNQPSFFSNDLLMYSSFIDTQNDIMMIDLRTGEQTNLTKTKESEYSPYRIPSTNSFATVRVEEDGTQRLWKFHLKSQTTPSLVFDDIAPVGYFAWNKKEVLMFVLGRPASLVISKAKRSKPDTIINNIGRTIKLIPGTQNFAFERREENGTIFIYKLNRSDKSFTKIVEKPANSSDWGITQQGTYITSVGSKLLKFNPKTDKEWHLLTDLEQIATGAISRMAVSKDNKRLALVINQ